MFHRNEAKLPHSLRLPLFALRVILGLNLFYAGFSTLFNPSQAPALAKRSLGGLYGWLGAATNIAWLHPVSRWALLVAGICLMLGFATRLASLTGVALLLASYLSNADLAHPNIFQLANNELIIALCLVVMVFSNAGSYFGLDAFFRFSLRHKK